MGRRIKLPKSLRSIIHNAFRLKGYEIMEAYVDEMAYKIKDGLGELRKFLDISKSESVCDCFLKIKINGVGERKLLLEEKKSKHSSRFRDAKRQLEISNEYFEAKNIKIDFAVVCKMSAEPPFEIRSGNVFPPLREVYIKLNGKPVFLENSSLNKIPLLYG